jgi:protein-S-isoprenylcysteine O-methyltransferase Ste14
VERSDNLDVKSAQSREGAKPLGNFSGENLMHMIAGALLIIEFILMWFMEKSVDLPWLDYIASAGWVIGIVLIFLPMPTLRRLGQVQEGDSYVETGKFVDGGVYAVVRHPQYLGWILMYVVTLLFNPSWILAIPGILGIGCVYWFTVREEAFLAEKFGEPYRLYLQAVPRFNLPAGGMRLILKRTT